MLDDCSLDKFRKHVQLYLPTYRLIFAILPKYRLIFSINSTISMTVKVPKLCTRCQIFLTFSTPSENENISSSPYRKDKL